MFSVLQIKFPCKILAIGCRKQGKTRLLGKILSSHCNAPKLAQVLTKCPEALKMWEHAIQDTNRYYSNNLDQVSKALETLIHIAPVNKIITNYMGKWEIGSKHQDNSQMDGEDVYTYHNCHESVPPMYRQNVIMERQYLYSGEKYQPPFLNFNWILCMSLGMHLEFHEQATRLAQQLGLTRSILLSLALDSSSWAFCNHGGVFVPYKIESHVN